MVAPLRRGFGTSGGDYIEDYRACSTSGLVQAGLRTAQDIQAAIDYMRYQPYVRDDEIISVGHSGGGWGSLALASQAPAGLKAVVNFAGGHGSYAGRRGVCNRPGLSDGAATYARTTHVHELWIYAVNDTWLWPELAKEMFDAYVAAGGQAQFVAAAADGEEGHAFVSTPTGIAAWSGPVEDFLRSHGLTVKEIPVPPDAPPPMKPPPGLSPAVARGFRTYLAEPRIDKAFAASSDGYFAWAAGRDSEEEAIKLALTFCARFSKKCKALSVDGQPVPPQPAQESTH